MARYVVVGAGQVGGQVCRLAVARGDEVVAVPRSGSGPDLPGVRRVAADAADAEMLARLARGADVLVNAVNPAYHRWPELFGPITRSLIGAAEASGAVLVTVSNLYGYGHVDRPMTEELPQHATTTKGRVRADMWRLALRAHQEGRVRTSEVRGSDYLCPGDQSPLGDRAMRPLLRGTRVGVLGSPDQPHTWTSPADVARLVVTVAEDERAWGRPWHVPSAPPRTQREALADLAAAAGVGAPTVGTVPAPVLRLVGLFSPPAREIREMLYEFTAPFVLDSSAAEHTFGLAPTPWAEQVAAQVAAYR